MNITVKLVSLDPFSPNGFDANGVGRLTMPAGACVQDVIDGLRLPGDEAYMTMVNETSIPISERDAHVLEEGDEVTIFPPIKGG